MVRRWPRTGRRSTSIQMDRGARGGDRRTRCGGLQAAWPPIMGERMGGSQTPAQHSAERAFRCGRPKHGGRPGITRGRKNHPRKAARAPRSRRYVDARQSRKYERGDRQGVNFIGGGGSAASGKDRAAEGGTIGGPGPAPIPFEVLVSGGWQPVGTSG